MLNHEWLELRDYLGGEFDGSLLPGGRRLALNTTKNKTWNHYYRQDNERLYVETGLGLNDMYEPAYRIIAEMVHPPEHVLDYRCGVGAAGLRLAIGGYQVAFADEEGTCLDYLKWRLKRRGMGNAVVALKRAERQPVAMLVADFLSIPQAEHWRFVEGLARAGDLCLVCFGPTPEGEGVDIGNLRRKIEAAYTLVRWEIFNAVYQFAAFRPPSSAERAEEVENGQ